MPLFSSFCRAFAAVSLLSITLSHAQQCYYPDGSPSTDVPCSSTTSAQSSCCGSTSFCMDNGLCFGGGIVSRGSCTDKSWDSAACADYCQSDTPGSSSPLTPCSNNGGSSTFVCGLDSAQCSNSSAVFSMSGGTSLVLRPSQVEALVGPAINSIAAQAATATVTAAAGATPGLYTAAQMASLGLGLGIPLLLAIGFAVFFFLRGTPLQFSSTKKLMYKLPDNHEDFTFRPPPATGFPSLPSRSPSEAGSVQTMHSAGAGYAGTPTHLKTFAERYQVLNEKVGKVAMRPVELPGEPMSPSSYELASRKK